ARRPWPAPGSAAGQDPRATSGWSVGGVLSILPISDAAERPDHVRRRFLGILLKGGGQQDEGNKYLMVIAPIGCKGCTGRRLQLPRSEEHTSETPVTSLSRMPSSA